MGRKWGGRCGGELGYVGSREGREVKRMMT